MISTKAFLENRENYRNMPFSNKEKEAIDNVEDFIDADIISGHSETSFSFELKIINFNYCPKTSKRMPFDEIRRVKMYDEICKRYKSNGWKLTIDTDDGCGMSTWEYWVISLK